MAPCTCVDLRCRLLTAIALRLSWCLNRYSGHRGWTFRDKISALVDFPETIDLSSRSLGVQAAPPVYDLYAVSVRCMWPVWQTGCVEF